MKYKRILYLLVFLSLAKIGYTQSKVDTILYKINKGIAVYNCVLNPELINAVTTFTDSTNVNIYLTPKIQDSTQIANMFNQLSDLKDPAKQAPYIQIIVWFIPNKQAGQHETYSVSVDLQPSPDIQLAADALQQIVDNINAALTGQIEPEDMPTINAALTGALDELKDLLGGIGDLISQLKPFFQDVFSEKKSSSEDSLQYYHEKSDGIDNRLDSLYVIVNTQDESNFPTGTGNGKASTFALLDDGNGPRTLDASEVADLKQNQEISEMEQEKNNRKLFQQRIEIHSDQLFAILELSMTQNINGLITQFSIDAVDFLSTLALEALSGAEEQQLKQMIRQFIEDEINDFLNSN